MKYAIYRADGKILRILDCDESMVALNSEPNEDYLEVPLEVTDDSHYVIEGVAGEPALIGIPEKPGKNYIFDYGSKTWVDPRNLEQLRSAQWEIIKAAREADLDAPLVTELGTFDAYAEARRNISDSVLLANNLTALGLPVDIDFTLEDNTVVRLNGAQMVSVGLALAARTQEIRNKATALRNQIELANAESIASINW